MQRLQVARLVGLHDDGVELFHLALLLANQHLRLAHPFGRLRPSAHTGVHLSLDTGLVIRKVLGHTLVQLDCRSLAQELALLLGAHILKGLQAMPVICNQEKLGEGDDVARVLWNLCGWFYTSSGRTRLVALGAQRLALLLGAHVAKVLLDQGGVLGAHLLLQLLDLVRLSRTCAIVRHASAELLTNFP